MLYTHAAIMAIMAGTKLRPAVESANAMEKHPGPPRLTFSIFNVASRRDSAPASGGDMLIRHEMCGRAGTSGDGMIRASRSETAGRARNPNRRESAI